MRRLLVPILLLCLAAAPARADADLDALFGKLKKEANAAAAGRIAKDIWAKWTNSGSASIDLMVGWANDAAEARKFDIALDFLDQVVLLQPDYAEGWNRRATVHFMMNDYAKAAADIERTLALEPRHFGALSGLAMILRSTDREAGALVAYEQVLAVYPANKEAQDAVAELSEKLAGNRI